MCCCLHHRHARNHRTDALLEDYGYNKLSEMQFAGNSSENCTRHAQLMITSNTLTASQQSLLNSQCGQLSNAQKMKWINSHSGQKAKAVINPSFILPLSSVSILCAHFFNTDKKIKSIPEIMWTTLEVMNNNVYFLLTQSVVL